MKTLILTSLAIISLSLNAQTGIKLVSVPKTACPGDSITIQYRFNYSGQKQIRSTGLNINFVWDLPIATLRHQPSQITGIDTTYSLRVLIPYYIETEVNIFIPSGSGLIYVPETSPQFPFTIKCNLTGIDEQSSTESKLEYFDLYGNRLIHPLPNTPMIEYREGRATKTIRIE